MAQPIIQLIPYDDTAALEYINMMNFFKLYFSSVPPLNPDDITPVITITYNLLAKCMIARLFKRDIEISTAAVAAGAIAVEAAITLDSLLEDIKTSIDLNTPLDVLNTNLTWLTRLPDTSLAHEYIRQIIDLLNIDREIGKKIYLDPNYAASWDRQKKAMVYLQIITLKEPEQDEPNTKMEALVKNHQLHKEVLEKLVQSGGGYQVSQRSDQLCIGVYCNTCTLIELTNYILNTCTRLNNTQSMENKRSRDLTIITELSNLNSKLTICTKSPHLNNKQPIKNLITYISGLISSQSIKKTDFNIQEFINLLEKLIIEVGAEEQPSTQSSATTAAQLAAQRQADVDAAAQRQKALYDAEAQRQQQKALYDAEARRQLLAQQLEEARQQAEALRLARQQQLDAERQRQLDAQLAAEVLRKTEDDAKAREDQQRLLAEQLEALRKAQEDLQRQEEDKRLQENLKKTQEKIRLTTELLDKQRELKQIESYYLEYIKELDNLIQKYYIELQIQRNQLSKNIKVKHLIPNGMDSDVTILEKYIRTLHDEYKKFSELNISDTDTTTITELIKYFDKLKTDINKYKEKIKNWLMLLEAEKQVTSQIVSGAASSGAASSSGSTGEPTGIKEGSKHTFNKYLKYKKKYFILKNKIFNINI